MSEPREFVAGTFTVSPTHDWGSLFCKDCGAWPDEYAGRIRCKGPTWRDLADRAARLSHDRGADAEWEALRKDIGPGLSHTLAMLDKHRPLIEAALRSVPAPTLPALDALSVGDDGKYHCRGCDGHDQVRDAV